MKKLFFTAIVMVAFSAVSMANTIEIKEIEVIAEKTLIDIEKASCTDIAISAYEFAMDSECGIPGSGCGGDSPELLNLFMGWCYL